MTREVRDRWEETAEYFQAEADIDVCVNWGWPDVDTEAMLGDVDGAAVLELGCGGGQCTVALARRGAAVTGIDLSTGQLSFAADLVAERGVEDEVDLVHGDVRTLPFADERFDVAFDTYVFQWVDDLEACFAETYRVLRPGGRFAFSTPHPYYELLDYETGEVTESYFETGRHVEVDEDLESDLVTYRHTVSEYHEALRSAGFEIETMLEPGSSNPDDYEEGPWGERRPGLLSKVPSVLLFAARKPA